MARQQQRPSIIYQEYKHDMDKAANALLRCEVDFTKRDALRTDVFIIENRPLYINDFYLSIWSPIFRDLLFPMKNRQVEDRKELIMDEKLNFLDAVQMLKCIYPEQQDIDDNNLTQVLPLAYEFQIDELLRRCINYIRTAQMKLIDKLILADHFRLNSLLKYCLKELRMQAQIDFQSATYLSLSDHTKVQILEKLQYSKSTMDDQISDIEIDDEYDEEATTIADASNFAKFTQKSEIYFASIRTKSGRHFYCNPYYLATWSRVINEQVNQRAECQNELTTTLSDEEMIILTPPLSQLFPHLTPTLRRQIARKSTPSTTEMFDSLALLDACYLFDLFEPYLRRVKNQEMLLSSFLIHPKYDTLSFRAKAALLDCQASLLSSNKESLGSWHICSKCHHRSTCTAVKWENLRMVPKHGSAHRSGNWIGCLKHGSPWIDGLRRIGLAKGKFHCQSNFLENATSTLHKLDNDSRAILVNVLQSFGYTAGDLLGVTFGSSGSNRKNDHCRLYGNITKYYTINGSWRGTPFPWCQNYDVIIVSWDSISVGLDYSAAIADARLVADTLAALRINVKLFLSTFLALDPAGPFFDCRPDVGLRKNVAQFVQVLHTDFTGVSHFGSNLDRGHVDFYVNDKNDSNGVQPGCLISEDTMISLLLQKREKTG
uniref:BTB domain-containing protein n=1 Tax=Romanomermis culicivorax TaxID=13658 RepID=A0A915K2I9_ROMCU